MISRRTFLSSAAVTGVLAAAGVGSRAVAVQGQTPAPAISLLRRPDSATAFSGNDQRLSLERAGADFAAKDVTVSFVESAEELRIRIHATNTPLTHIRLRWLAKVSPALLCLGDHWERSYGDLAWRGITPERVMPWYFATHNGQSLNAYGVKTGAAALCFWQIDPEGITLWLDVSNGGDGVLLSGRELSAATVVMRRGTAGESPLNVLRSFCRQMSPAPRLPKGAVYGVNDWYCAYGNNNQAMLLRMADLAAELAPQNGERPHAIVDMGWKEGSAAFPSMAAYAAQVKQRGVRPGIWVRPLEATEEVDSKLLLPPARFGARTERGRERAFDPTIPEALELVRRKVKDLAGWGFELVKHDFSTYDLLGQWGFEMGPQPAIPGWHFYDRSRTNAEIIRDFYMMLRSTLGEKISILGCNTIGHLGAGIFELQRTGDDTSGKIWERTRRMGINTLAYRLPQHGTFFHLDADCVGITSAVPWRLNCQWLDLVARSRTTLFISPEEGQVGAEQKKALREAFAIVTSAAAAAEPADFLHGTTPELWKTADGVKHYTWCEEEGADPFTV